MLHRTERLAGIECGCLSSGDSKRGKMIQRQGLENVRTGRGYVGTCGGGLEERELVFESYCPSMKFVTIITSLYASFSPPSKRVRVCGFRGAPWWLWDSVSPSGKRAEWDWKHCLGSLSANPQWRALLSLTSASHSFQPS